MIDIIKQGDPSKTDNYVQFECANCGCIWKADHSDYKYELTEWLQEMYTASCPNCNETTWVVKECFNERDV